MTPDNESAFDHAAFHAERRREMLVKYIMQERRRQERLKQDGRFRHTCADLEMPIGEKLACLGEEYGEVCRALMEQTGAANDRHGVQLRTELIELAAVALAWLESIDAENEARQAEPPGVRP